MSIYPIWAYCQNCMERQNFIYYPHIDEWRCGACETPNEGIKLKLALEAVRKVADKYEESSKED